MWFNEFLGVVITATPFFLYCTNPLIKRYNKTVTDEKDTLPDIPLHSLRHTSATLLISQNIDVKTISNRWGHSQASTTIDFYTHALKQLDKKAAETLDTLLVKCQHDT